MVILLLGAAAVVVIMLDVQGAPRAAALAPFLLAGPGLAWTTMTRVRSVMFELLLALMLSLAIETLAGVTLAAFDVWSPERMLTATMAVTGVGLLVSTWHGPRATWDEGDGT